MHWSLTKTMHAKGCLAGMPASLNSPRLPLSSPVQYQKITQTRSHHIVSTFSEVGVKNALAAPYRPGCRQFCCNNNNNGSAGVFNCQRSEVCVSLNAESTPLARLAKISYLHGSYTRTAVRLILLPCVKRDPKPGPVLVLN